MTRDEMHIKALSKGVDSQKIKGSMTVVLLGHAVDMMMEMQDQHEAELKAYEAKIEDIATDLQDISQYLKDEVHPRCEYDIYSRLEDLNAAVLQKLEELN